MKRGGAKGGKGHRQSRYPLLDITQIPGVAHSRYARDGSFAPYNDTSMNLPGPPQSATDGDVIIRQRLQLSRSRDKSLDRQGWRQTLLRLWR